MDIRSRGQMVEKGSDNIQCRLDRAMAMQYFLNRFYPTKVTHLSRFGSDHVVVRVELEVVLENNERRRKHLFRFEEAWTRDKNCERVVKEIWQNSLGQGAAKIGGMKRIEDEFQEYKVSAIMKELRRIEDLLKDDAHWESNE